MNAKSTLFSFLLANSQPVNWRQWKSVKTPFGTEVDIERTDVLVAFIESDSPLPSSGRNGYFEGIPEHYDAEMVAKISMVDKEPITSKNLAMALIIPEELSKYELQMWRKGHVPVFTINGGN